MTLTKLPNHTAYKIQKHLKSYVDLQILEKSPELGGTWYENRYPGMSCDPALTRFLTHGFRLRVRRSQSLLPVLICSKPRLVKIVSKIIHPGP